MYILFDLGLLNATVFGLGCATSSVNIPNSLDFRALDIMRNYQDCRFGVDGMQPLVHIKSILKYKPPTTADTEVMRQMP